MVGPGRYINKFMISGLQNADSSHSCWGETSLGYYDFARENLGSVSKITWVAAACGYDGVTICLSTSLCYQPFYGNTHQKYHLNLYRRLRKRSKLIANAGMGIG